MKEIINNGVMIQEAYKCIGVWKNKYRLYYDGKHNEFFVLTPKFRITQSPRRISDELADWCNHMMGMFRRGNINGNNNG
jgi:hypothetical protein